MYIPQFVMGFTVSNNWFKGKDNYCISTVLNFYIQGPESKMVTNSSASRIHCVEDFESIFSPLNSLEKRAVKQLFSKDLQLSKRFVLRIPKSMILFPNVSPDSRVHASESIQYKQDPYLLLNFSTTFSAIH